MAHVQSRYEGSSRFPTQRLLPMARASQCDLRQSHTCRRRRCVSRVECGWKRQRSTSITLQGGVSEHRTLLGRTPPKRVRCPLTPPVLHPMLDMFDSPAGRSPARVAACLITTHSPGKLRVRLSTATFGCLGCKGQRSSWHVWSVSVGLFASMLSSREAGQYHTCDLSKEFQRNNANRAPNNPL